MNMKKGQKKAPVKDPIKDSVETIITTEEILATTTNQLKEEKHTTAELRLDSSDGLQLAQILRNYAGQLSPRVQSMLASNIISILSLKPPK